MVLGPKTPEGNSGECHAKPDYELKEFKSIFNFDRGFLFGQPGAEMSLGSGRYFGRNFESCGQECLKGERTKGTLYLHDSRV